MNQLDLRSERPLLIGVVHLAPTPGAPLHGSGGPGSPARGLAALLERAAEDARALAEGGADAAVVENFGDVPFFATRVPPETIATMTRAVLEVARAAPGLALGVNVLRNDARAALGICAATGASFLRVNVHTGAAATDQGLIEGDAARTLRERARLCPGVQLLADVHVKHARPMGGRSLEEEAADTALRGLADGLIVSGAATGAAPPAERVERVRGAACGRPVLIGSGLTSANARELFGSGARAAGAIVGTSLKRDGRVDEPVDPERVRELRRTLDRL